MIRLISSSTGGIPESSWRVLLLMYQGALKGMRNILDCILCRTFVLDGLGVFYGTDLNCGVRHIFDLSCSGLT